MNKSKLEISLNDVDALSDVESAIDSKTRCRNWFVTVNQNSECFSRVVDILEKEIDTKKCNWACCLHDKDDDTKPHYHIVLSFDDAKSFSRIQKLFAGSHIEICRQLGQSYGYLTHDTSSARKDKKHIYEIDDVITNNRDFFDLQVRQISYEMYDPSQIIKYVFVDGTDNIALAMVRFGSQMYRNLNAWREAITVYKSFPTKEKYNFYINNKSSDVNGDVNNFDNPGKCSDVNADVNIINNEGNESSVNQNGNFILTEFGEIYYTSVLRYEVFDKLSLIDFEVIRQFFATDYENLDLEIVKKRLYPQNFQYELAL